jgi:hypothetical protein
MTGETGAGAGDAARDPAAPDNAAPDDAAAGHASVQGAAEDPASRADVDVSDPASLQRWAQALGIPPEALEGAVKAVGTRVDRIKDYLTGGIAGDQEDA